MTVEAFEDILGFVVVIVAMIASINKNKKKKQQTQARKAERQTAVSHRTKQWPELEKSIQAFFEEQKIEQPTEPAAVPAGAGRNAGMAEMTHEGRHPCAEHTSAPAQVAHPSIQARVQVTEKPRVVLGSMGTDTHEGIHPCDEHEDGLLQGDRPLVAMPVEKPGLQLDWTGENMVKAFIMQEVLTRPCQRKRA